MRTALLGILLVGLLAAPALADVVTLADGSKREGKVLKETDQEVVLQVTQGRLSAEITFKRSEVKSVERGQTAAEKVLAEVERRKAALKDKDAVGWLEFAQWLDKQPGFSRDVREACEKVVSLEPNNDWARTRLGYQRLGGQWLSEAEVMAARGLVAYQGRWVTPGEKKAAEETAADRTEDITVLTPEELRKRRAQEQLDGKKLAEWQAQMLSRAAGVAAQTYPPGVVSVRSGGVVLGPYGYGFYGVTTTDGQYLPFVPYRGLNDTYLFNGVWFGTDGPMFFDSYNTTDYGRFRFNFDYNTRHIHLRLNSGR